MAIKIQACDCCGYFHDVTQPASIHGIADLAKLDCRHDELRYASPEDAQERNGGAEIIEVDEDGICSVVLMKAKQVEDLRYDEFTDFQGRGAESF